MRARRNTATLRICRQRDEEARRIFPPRHARSSRGSGGAPSLPLAGEGQGGGPTSPASQKSTNPTSTKCTARSPCPTAPTALPRASRTSAAAAKSSSQPTRANPAPNSAPPRDPAAARRGIAADGRSGNPARHLAPLPRREMLRRQIDLPNSLSKSNSPGSIRHTPRIHAAGFETCVRTRMDIDRCGRVFRSARYRHERGE